MIGRRLREAPELSADDPPSQAIAAQLEILRTAEATAGGPYAPERARRLSCALAAGEPHSSD
jgi:hypothetical protein